MLTDRQLKILQLVIRLYTEQHEPVGSKTLLSQTDLPFSSATIRNEMMRLEELGFLEKTHSSSGRVPSVSGYRFYVDNLLPALDMSQNEIVNVKQAFKQRAQQINDIVDMSAKMLSSLTNYTTIVLGPETTKSKLTGFRLVPIDKHQVMAILVTDKGAVENQLFTLPQGVSPIDIEKVVGILNEELIGLNLSEVYEKLQKDIPNIIQDNMNIKFDILPILQSLMMRLEAERLFIAGKNNLIDYYENDRAHLKHVYDMLENANAVYELMTPNHKGVDIKFGSELNHESFKDLSVVTTTYETNNGTGIIALVGPTNMSYSRVVGLMNVMSEELRDSINDYFDHYLGG
ncbi:heat-inducible transcription repressor HrcA [Carnobacteriaceae bacterium zg-ZUI252]|nr:heat-inducible transcription repressor HrcA [Carnobacteriaceae bacterium zg-ZUI252]MBS4770018.1 heat-inducible transcription repressor HrcA [Carnobacteriaceae bacterium zg-ZUI240]QTU83243.1 heat-inducible transcription repressor HrcA [Carnobacteriaceae bacterium zg-C25]